MRIIAPSTPGGSLDELARLLAPPLSQKWHQQVIVDDRPGAAGIIGTQLVADAAPNGATLLMVTTGFTNNPFLYKKLPYKIPDSFAPITIIATNADVMVINPHAPFHTLKELIAQAKAAPGTISYGSSGVGTGGHLVVSLIEALAGIKLNHVPYKGAGASLTGVVGNEVPMIVTAVGAAQPFIKSGSLIAVAVTGKSSGLPDVPTIAEAGLPNYSSTGWQGLFAPAGTPKPVIDKIYADVKEALADPARQQQMRNMGFDPDPITPAEFATFLQGDLKRAELSIQAAGIKPE